MDSPGWMENPDWIPGKNWNGFTQLEGKPGLDFWQKLEWIHPVGAKTRTGFLAKTGMDSPGWSENPDWIPGKNWNGFTRLERKPGLVGFSENPDWIPGKNWNGFENPGWMDSPKNPDWIPGKNWNGFTRLERKNWIHPGAKTRTGFLAKTGMDSPGWLEQKLEPVGGKPGLDSWQKLEWIHPVGAKTWTGLPPENWNGVAWLDSPNLTFQKVPDNFHLILSHMPFFGALNTSQHSHATAPLVTHQSPHCLNQGPPKYKGCASLSSASTAELLFLGCWSERKAASRHSSAGPHTPASTAVVLQQAAGAELLWDLELQSCPACPACVTQSCKHSQSTVCRL
ncbi:hypothetical protein DUI87_15417 [Hirundo rustica rustica]|uniref:Uncharacterized protein n=1 Tax=Hirundo rustica rustica TaxID=333673 RepID=A0A3M0K430_HIRRU|nr:hypothetical protein DUI87_15417 [Hirundo rustica rustica]